MRVLICNERFLFRFGVDRALILLGKGLAERGHSVHVMGNRFDRKVVDAFASRIIEAPVDADYLNMNEYTARWLEKSWGRHFTGDDEPEIVLFGGWPFFSAVPVFKGHGAKVVFMDCGAVPLEGFSGGHLVVQEKLRGLRRRYLPETSHIMGISRFITESQSRPDSGCSVPTSVVLLGADHVERPVWNSEEVDLAEGGSAVGIVDRLRASGRSTLLNLGRWEPDCYKNSGAAFEILRKVVADFPGCALLVLAEPSGIAVPRDLKDSVFPLGFPDDGELINIMKRVDVGLSVSLWEGFNLPLAEMQWLDRPALAFDLAAHPEVSLHPWYLCRDSGEMASKVCDILSGRGLNNAVREIAAENFRGYFRWDRFVEECCTLFRGVMEEAPSGARPPSEIRRIPVIVDVTNSSRDPANSGVIRITRRLCREFQRYLDPVFAVWDEARGTYVFPTEKEYWQLGRFNGPFMTENNQMISSETVRRELGEQLGSLWLPGWLFLPETVMERNAVRIRDFARRQGLGVAAIFYDAIPVLHPELCRDEAIRNNHSDYMKGLAECDVVIPISGFSAQCLRDFWAEKGINGCRVVPCLLPGEFAGSSRRTAVTEEVGGQARILCVSTLEPRKNHLRLVHACLKMEKLHPDLDWSLTLVGNRYAGAFEIADAIESFAAGNPRITWQGIVDDETLQRLYDESSFTVYPSLIEGFGMPVLESVWHGKPCLCSRDGVMAELAAGGGCLTTDVTDEEAMAESIYRLATDRALLKQLSEEAASRKIKVWDEYVREVISLLKVEHAQSARPSPAVSTLLKAEEAAPDWRDIIYKGCLCGNWQMNDSERLAMIAFLARLKPKCSIEVGTYHGGSLSLLVQYSEMVFSIDIDPDIPRKLASFESVSFLTGPSEVVLPSLLKELDSSGIAVDFILIDGDHSAEGIKRDLDIVLSYVPRGPLFVIMHDSFNPGCRDGMLAADWEKSPYVAFVDIDFIPGRLVEHGGGGHGEMWGGLALVYMTPEARKGGLVVETSAGEMFRTVKDASSGDSHGGGV